MMYFRFMLIIACVGICASSVFAQDTEVSKSGGTVRGKIVDTTATENPIEGVEVTILAPDSTEYTATTDTNGEFVLVGIPEARYLISINKEGYNEQIGIRLIVVNGGDHFVPLKMTQKKSTVPSHQKHKDKKQNRFENMPQDSHGHWYDFTLMNTKIGYMHISDEKTEYQGEPMTRHKSNVVMNLKALGTDLALEITNIEYVGADSRLRHFLHTSNVSGLKQVEGRIVDGIAYIKTTLNGETSASEVPVPQDTISQSPGGVESLFFQEGFKIGDKQTFHVFSFDLMKPVKAEIEIARQETLTYQSEEKQVYVLDGTLDMMGGTTIKQWVSTDGINYRTETLLMGVSQVATKTDMETALGDVEEVDLVLKTRIVPSGKRPIPKAENLVADVKLTTGNIGEAIMSTSRQKLALSSTQSGRLSVQIPMVVGENCPELPIQNAESEFLAASAYIQAAHPDIQAKAKEILANEVNSWGAAERLCQWVYESITDKTVSSGFGSSLNTLESLAGDCTEHTVLFIALARAAGIPSRICSGIVFSKDAFYYHFWPEVYVGQWVQMDPTLNQVIADANHIQFWGGFLESDTMVEFAEGVYRTLNQLEIVVIE